MPLNCWTLAAAALAVLPAALCQSTSLDTSVYEPLQLVGGPDGNAVALYGCEGNGATLDYINVYANSLFIRGIQVHLTDGREAFWGCLNTTYGPTVFQSCNDSDIRSADFSINPGESVVNMTLWPGTDSDGNADMRAGALNVVTNTGRTFDFGMTATRSDPVSVALGSGIACGLAPKAGADIDALGFVFMLPVTSATLMDVIYSGIPASEVDAAGLEVALSQIDLANATYDNSGNSTGSSYTYAGTTELEQAAAWSRAPNGVDSIIASNVTAPEPQLATGGNGNQPDGWTLSAESAFARDGSVSNTKNWSYTVDVPAGAIYAAVAYVTQADVTVPYSGNLSVALTSGTSIIIPTSGNFTGTVASPVTYTIDEIKAPDSGANGTDVASAQAGSNGGGGGSGGSHTALILGLVFGILGGLIFAALVAWAVVLIMHRRQKDSEERGPAPTPKQPPIWLIPAGALPWKLGGKGDGGKGLDLEAGGKGATKGSKADDAWEKADPKVALGVPIGPAGRRSEDSSAGTRQDDADVLPYGLYRKLQLDRIRSALGLGRASVNRGDVTSASAAAAALELSGVAHKGDVTSENKGDATPLGLEGVSEAEYQPPTPIGKGEAKAAAPTPASKGTAGVTEVPASASVTASDKPIISEEQRLPTSSTASGAGSEKGAGESAAPTLRERLRAAAQRAVPSKAALTPKEGSRLGQLARSLSSKTPSKATPVVQQDDEAISPGSGKKEAAWPAVAAGSSSELPKVHPSSSGRDRTVEHNDTVLKLGDKYKTPEEAKSNAKGLIAVDEQILKLGQKYHTQGRNE